MSTPPARARRSGPVISHLTYPAVALGALTVLVAGRPAGSPAAPAPGFAVRYRNVVSPDRVRALTVLPNETVTLEVVARAPGSAYVARPAAGRLVPLGTGGGRWEWTAPPAPGLYPIQVIAPDGSDSVTLQAFVVVPYDRRQGEFLNGYRIGRYPEKPIRGPGGYAPPAGFVEVTRENEDVLVSPHFRLKQFLCKQPAGYRASTFHVMSGYRTPAYNRSLGNVRYSQHQWGAAADIFIDQNGDGVMDDLNGDGRSDMRDAEVLYRLIDAAAGRPEAQGLIGGIGKYRSTAAHGPFVHVDVRAGKARWQGNS